MSANTQDANKNRQALHEYEEIWLFGYGSLIYKVDFPCLQKSPAFITGWARRFWQGSHDHRGTPEQPGRVVTLIEDPDNRCDGMAYKVTADVFEHLDHREKNGYLRHEVQINLIDECGTETKKLGLIYIADEENLAYLGGASEQVIAQQISSSSGASGQNREYVLKLASALRELDAHDEHVFLIERYLIERGK